MDVRGAIGILEIGVSNINELTCVEQEIATHIKFDFLQVINEGYYDTI